MKTILVPIDFSPVTPAVLARATELARGFRARLVLLVALVPPVLLQEFAPPPERLRRVLVGAEKSVQRRLKALVQRLAARSVLVDSVLAHGEPVRAIVEGARRTAAAYIVIGSHGHSAFYELVAGSTTHGVLKRAPCPVVVVPSQRRPARRPASR
jgi:nucleotide-binding universal stress UspA family protein